jgi:plasmid stabilization system protein ParE
MYQLNWSRLARLTFADEQDFIFRKWNQTEVDKFDVLVVDWLESIIKTPTIGIYNEHYNLFSLVISKQSTLFYRIKETEMKLELILFWNNSQNPIHLDKLLKM